MCVSYEQAAKALELGQWGKGRDVISYLPKQSRIMIRFSRP